MSDPIMTDTPTSMRERLARAVIPAMDCAARYDSGPTSCKPEQWELCGCATAVVDAILRELQEPSEGIRSQYHEAFWINWEDCLEQIMKERSTARIPHEGRTTEEERKA